MSPGSIASIKKNSHLTAPILVDSGEAEIMRALRMHGRISRSEISNITGWSKAKASQEIKSLVDKGYLVEIGEGASQGGRKPRLLRINNQLGYIVGIDIGATSLEVVLADVTGSILQRQLEAADVHLRPESVLGRCREILLDLIKLQGAVPDQILGIGVGVPGPVDFACGFLVVGNTGVVFINLGQPFLFPSIAAVAVGGTLLSGGKGSYWSTMAGAIVLTLITSLLTTMQMPDSVRRMVLDTTLLILISIYGRQRALRQ